MCLLSPTAQSDVSFVPSFVIKSSLLWHDGLNIRYLDQDKGTNQISWIPKIESTSSLTHCNALMEASQQWPCLRICQIPACVVHCTLCLNWKIIFCLILCFSVLNLHWRLFKQETEKAQPQTKRPHHKKLSSAFSQLPAQQLTRRPQHLKRASRRPQGCQEARGRFC